MHHPWRRAASLVAEGACPPHARKRRRGRDADTAGSLVRDAPAAGYIAFYGHPRSPGTADTARTCHGMQEVAIVRARILTINVENFEGDPRRQDALRTGIQQLDPDLVALQEVIHSPERHQLDELLDGTKLAGTHQSEMLAYEPPWADRYGGTALASRWPYRVVETLDLRLAAASDVPWCTMAAVVEVPDAGPMLFVGSTGSWRLDAAATRERQALAVTDLDARHRQELPTVIAGDFNADPDSSSIRYLTGRQSLAGSSVHYHDAWEVAGDGPGYTWTVDNPNAAAVMDQVARQPYSRRRFDYVFAGSAHAHPSGSCRILSARLAFDRPIDGVWPSDHYGVVVDTEIETIRAS